MYTIIPTEKFKSDIEYYEKKKKFRHIDSDIGTVIKELVKGDLIGDPIDGIGEFNDSDNKVVKVRVANTDTKMGKSNGYRMIYYAIKEDYSIYLLSIYYKKDDKRILTDDQIIKLVKDNCL